MKRFFKFMLSLCLCFSLFVIPVFANNTLDCSVPSETNQEEIQPRTYTELLRVGPTELDGTLYYTITPTKGTNLKITGWSMSTPTFVFIRRNGKVLNTVELPGDSKTYQLDFYNNCDGGSYSIGVTHYSFSTFCFAIGQTEYH